MEFDLTLHKITAINVLQRAFYIEDISEPVIFSLLHKQRRKTSTSVFNTSICTSTVPTLYVIQLFKLNRRIKVFSMATWADRWCRFMLLSSIKFHSECVFAFS